MNQDTSLWGLGKSAAKALAGFARFLVGAFESSLMRIFVLFVVGAAVLSVIEHTGSKASGTMDWYRLTMLGLGAIIAEMMGVQRMIIYWHKARAFSMLAWGCVWFVGFAFAFYNAVGTSANTAASTTNLHKAAFKTSQTVDANLEDARTKLHREEKALDDVRALTFTPLPNVDGKPVSSPAAAQALIAGFKSNTRFWTDLTEGCTKSGGKETRKFCKDYNDAVAAKADLEDRKGWDGKLVAAQAQVDAARAIFNAALEKSGTTQTVVSDVPPFLAFVSSRTGMPIDQISWIEPAQVSLVNMLLVSFAGLVMGLAAIEGTPRTPWVNWARIWRACFGGPEVRRSAPVDPINSSVARLVPQQHRRLKTMSGRDLAVG